MPCPHVLWLSSLTTQTNKDLRTTCLSSHCHCLGIIVPLSLAGTHHHDAPAWITGCLPCPLNHTSHSLQKKLFLVTESTFLTFLPTVPQVHVPRASFLLNYLMPPQLSVGVTTLPNLYGWGGSASLMQVSIMSPRWTFEWQSPKHAVTWPAHLFEHL